MTVVPSGSEWDAMVKAAADAFYGMPMHEHAPRVQAAYYRPIEKALLAALRAVTTEPCATCGEHPCQITCSGARPVRSFAAPRVLVDLEVLEDLGAQPIIADDLGSAAWHSVFAVRPVEAE